RGAFAGTEPDVPLAERAAHVAKRFEILRDEFLGDWQSLCAARFTSSELIIQAVPFGMPAREYAAARRRATGRSDIKTRATHAFRREPIDVRRLDEYVAITPQIAVTHVIDEQQKDVRFGSRLGGGKVEARSPK